MLYTLANPETSGLLDKRQSKGAPQDPNEFRFNLANALQSSLDLHEILANFYQMLQRVIRCSGMEYNLQTRNIRLALGTHRAHRAHYTLKRGEIAVGEITFFRGAKFNEPELNKLEALLTLLMLPLRNALLYTPENSEICIVLTETGDGEQYRIDIIDQGPGVPEDARHLPGHGG